MRVDYQRISQEMYESREDREPRSNKVMIVGLVLMIALPVATVLYFGIIYLSLAHELRGF